MLRYADGWSLFSLISDVSATHKGAGYEINSYTSSSPLRGSTNAQGASILVGMLMLNESQMRQPWDLTIH